MSRRLKMEKGSGNIFIDVGFPPEEALNLQMRSELMVSHSLRSVCSFEVTGASGAKIFCCPLTGAG